MHKAIFEGLAAASALLFASGVLAAGGSCMPRALAAAEKAAGERVAARLLPMLPPAPPGWKVRDQDRTDIASGSCLDSASKKMIPQPVSVLVIRSFLRDDPAPTPASAKAAAAAPVPATPAAAGAEEQARAQALEHSIVELQRKEKDATTAYQAARRAGDSEGQKKASQELREYRAAMNPPRKELMELREGERRQREAQSKVSTEAAFARAEEELANRRVASVSLLTNSGQMQVRGSKPVSVAGVPLALRQARGATHLLFGDWKHFGNYAASPFDLSAPTTRVQDVSVRILGNDEVTTQLLGKIDLNAVRSVMQR
ncbi:MAG: hypothetical protein JWN13_2264 [Betaproteobacteria bacterium]|jgi:hypothetical protein|nr:hypothetical protein [Betaproteobacteria bacterium]